MIICLVERQDLHYVLSFFGVRAAAKRLVLFVLMGRNGVNGVNGIYGDFSLFTFHFSLFPLPLIEVFWVRIFRVKRRRMLQGIINFFRRKKKQEKPLPLRVEGGETTITPQPDDAELAAQALLEHLGKNGVNGRNGRNGSNGEPATESKGTVAYYHRLADRIREGRATEARLALRYVAYCEEQLRNPQLPIGQLFALENELYQRLDIIEREGGELKRRWQHCLAEVTVRMMERGK